MSTSNGDYIRASMFKVTIEGHDWDHFETVSGIGVELEDIAHQAEKGNGMENRPGRFNATDITLVRKFKEDQELYDWLQTGKDGKKTKKTASIILQSDEGNPIMRFDLEQAWVKAWRAPALSKLRGADDIPKETIVLSVHDVKMKKA